MNDDGFFLKDELLIPENMISMYARGAFPMADETGEINWYLPDVRTIIPLNSFNEPRSLRIFLKISDFIYKYDSAPLQVIKECAHREPTWISDELIEAYKGLIKLGHLHSVEVYRGNLLVGGLYGVTYAGAFFGESMFSKIPQASKCALVKLIERLKERGFLLLDVQYQTDHLKMFGAKEIPFPEFAAMLLESYTRKAVFN